MASSFKFKLLALGDSSVGKTSLIDRFVNDHFEDIDNKPTLGDSGIKTVTIDGHPVEISIRDTGGEERFGGITSTFYVGISGIMVIFDLADCSSFDSVKVWFREIERYTAITPAKILVGNKRDLTIEIDDAEPTQIANHYGIKYLKVSAKTGEGVADAFTQLAAECLRKAMPAAAPEPEIVVTPVDTPKPSAPPKESAHREKKEGGCSV